MTRRNDDPEECARTLAGCVKFSERRGWRVTEGGRHTKATAANGYSAVYPRHRGEYPRGTQRSILRMWQAMGAAAVIVALAVQFI